MFARESGRYLSIAFVVAGVLLGLAGLENGRWWTAFLLYLPVFAFFLFFFRDPERVPGEGVVSPADGRVLAVHEGDESPHLVIFMTPLSVHVNRSPLPGRVARTEYRRGGHLPAFKKESERNERFDLELATASGPCRIGLIAGTVARRIHPYVFPGNDVKKGDRIGLIAFGSRCELSLPSGRFRWAVRVGDWVRAGETTVAREEPPSDER